MLWQRSAAEQRVTAARGKCTHTSGSLTDSHSRGSTEETELNEASLRIIQHWRGGLGGAVGNRGSSQSTKLHVLGQVEPPAPPESFWAKWSHQHLQRASGAAEDVMETKHWASLICFFTRGTQENIQSSNRVNINLLLLLETLTRNYSANQLSASCCFKIKVWKTTAENWAWR